MSIESDLRKDGIEVVSKLDTLKVNQLARNISTRIYNTFPQFQFKPNELFIKLSRLDMYTAKMPEGMAEANYFYKNSSIYFNYKIPFEDLEEFAVHECIHFLQEVKDKRNYLVRMGLCDYTEFKIYGMGLNEAAVQLMSSKIINIPKDYVKYFGISFSTTSPSYYPLECCLVNQLGYIVGEDILFESTIKSTDDFKNALISLISEKNFLTIQENLDTILYTEEEIIKLTNKLYKIEDGDKKVNSVNKKIEDLKNKITNIFIKTQNLIISSYFDSAFEDITNLEELDNYRKKLYNFKELIGTTEDYTFFDDYFIEKMSELEHKSNIMENSGLETAITTKKKNKFLTFLTKLKNFLLNKSTKEEKLN